MATTNDLKNGLVMVIDGQLWQVVEFQHVKPFFRSLVVATGVPHL